VLALNFKNLLAHASVLQLRDKVEVKIDFTYRLAQILEPKCICS